MRPFRALVVAAVAAAASLLIWCLTTTSTPPSPPPFATPNPNQTSLHQPPPSPDRVQNQDMHEGLSGLLQTIHPNDPSTSGSSPILIRHVKDSLDMNNVTRGVPWGPVSEEEVKKVFFEGRLNRWGTNHKWSEGTSGSGHGGGRNEGDHRGIIFPNYLNHAEAGGIDHEMIFNMDDVHAGGDAEHTQQDVISIPSSVEEHIRVDDSDEEEEGEGDERRSSEGM